MMDDPKTPRRQGKGRAGALAAVLVVLMVLLATGPGQANDDGITDYVTIPAGSYIIDMGITPQTTANGMKPYGLVYDLSRNQKIPVLWAINPGKAKDGVDFTDTNSGKSYRGGPFIIAAEYLTAGVLSTINAWKAQGVAVDGPTTGPIANVPIYHAIAGLGNVVLDTKNGDIAATILGRAGIPVTSYRLALPPELTTCDDMFTLPHADPTWATHGTLIDFVKNRGYLWAGCHAVSMLENIDNPGTPTINPDMNFLSLTGLVPFGSHKDGSPPYQSAYPGEPVMQFMGASDAAHQNGSEQIYLPKLAGGWRPGARVAVYDPTQVNVPALSPGPAAAIVYGRAYDVSSYGLVMYEGGHDVAGSTTPAFIAAQRAYLNFWLLSMLDRSPGAAISASAGSVPEGNTISLTATVNHPYPVTYQWSSVGGGTFGSPNAATTTFTAPQVAGDTTVYIRLVLTDACGRTGYDMAATTVLNVPKADLSILKTDAADPVAVSAAFSYSLAVSNPGTEPATNVVVEDVLPAALTYGGAGGTDWTCSHDPGTGKLTCTRATLPLTMGTPSVITVNVTAPAAPTLVTNTATVTADEPDPDPANNTSTQTTTVLQGIDVEIVKNAPAGPFFSSQPVSYNLNVRNISAAQPATSLTVTDVLPASLTYVSATGPGWNCVYRSGDRTVTCFLSSLAALATSTITLTVIPAGAGGETIANTATVTSPDFVDQNMANNTSTATITLNATADLAISKTGVASDTPSKRDIWTVTLTNTGPGTAAGVVVTDAMSGNGLDKYNATTACTVVPSTGSISPASPWSRAQLQSGGTWSIAAMASGDTATLTFTCIGDNNDGVLNEARVASSSFDPDTTNNATSYWLNRDTTKNGDIQITKTDSPDPVVVEGTITYRITLNNLGTEDANNTHTVVDSLPPGAIYAGFVSASTNNPGGIWTCPAVPVPPSPPIVGPATVTCTTNSDLKKATGSPNSLYFDLIVTAPSTPGSITNTARTRYTWGNDIYDPPANNTASATTQVIPRATDIAVTKTVNNATPVLYGTVVFTVTARNIGPVPATNLRLTDLLPAGLTHVGSTPSQGSYNPATGLWYIGNLASGAAATLTITATVGLGDTTNTACLYALDQTDTNAANDCATPTPALAPRYAELRLTKTASTLVPSVNDNVVFTVTLHNNGPTAVDSAAINDVLPEGLEFVSAAASMGTYDPETGNWAFAGQNLASGADATLTLTAAVKVPAAPLTNTATIVSSALPDPDTTNNSAAVTVTGQQADIAVAKTVDIEVPLVLNTPLTFTVTVQNNGPSDATGIVVTDVLPAGLSYQSHTASQGSFDPVSGVWSVGALTPRTGEPPAPVATLTLVAKNIAYGDFSNTAAVTAVDQYDPDDTNDTASVSVLSGGAANLEVTKIVDDPFTYQGDTVTFTVRLRNLGPNPATGVVVNDLLPADLTYVSHVASQGAYSPATGDWAAGDLAAPLTVAGEVIYQTVILDITAKVNSAGTFTNTAAVTALNQADPDESNNTAATIVDAQPAADLAVTKTGPTSVNLSAPVSYTLVARNLGPADATGAIIADTVPAQIMGVSWSCAAAGDADCDTTAPGTGASGAGNAITLSHVQIKAGAGNHLTITVNGTTGATGTFTNTVIFSPPPDISIFDPDTGNNSASVTTVVSKVLLTGRVFADTGTGGGTANNGVLDGGEVGIAKVTVSITDCGATVHAAATTDGNGNYTLAIPETITPGTTLCAVETNLAGYTSTGGQAGDTEGTYDRGTDRVQFVLKADTNYAGVNFGDVPENRFLTDGTNTALPGTTVTYPHIFIAGTGGQVTFSTFAAASPSIPGWSQVLYLDSDCDGILQTPVDQALSGPITVVENQRVCLLQQEFVPANAPPSASNLVTVRADFVYTNAGPALTAGHTRQDLTTVSDVALQLTKEVRNITQGSAWATNNTAKSGDVLEYRITYLNTGLNPINTLVVHDSTTAFTTFVAAQCGLPLPAQLTSCVVTTAPDVGGTGPIAWTFSGSLASQLSGTVTFSVAVD